MDIKRALIAAVISYAVVFLAISAMVAIQFTNNYVNIVLVTVVAYLVASMYYFKSKSHEPLKDGFMLGIVMTVVAMVIEIPVMAYGFAADMGMAWFTQWNIIVGYVLVVVAAIAAAYMKKK